MHTMVKVQRTIEEISLGFGMHAAFECETYANVETERADPSVGILPGFDYHFSGEVFITDISVYDAEDNPVSVEISDTEKEWLNARAITAFKALVEWDEDWDTDVADSIGETLADRDDTAREDAAEAKLDAMRNGD